MTPGSPDTPLTAPDMHRLRDTKANGNCLFRAFSVLLTGTEHAHRKVRLAIVQHLLDNEQLFIHNAALDCSDPTWRTTLWHIKCGAVAGEGLRRSLLWLTCSADVYTISVECVGAEMRIVPPSLTAPLTLQVVRRHCTSITWGTTIKLSCQ